MYAIAASPSVATNPGCVAITWGRCQPSGIRLLRVSESGHEEVVRMLLEIGADANAVAAANETGMGAKQTSLRLLLEKGAHIHLKEEQMTTLDLATKTAHKDVAQLLLEEGEKQREPKETVLNLAAKKGHVEAVRLLRKAVVELLLENCAEVNSEKEEREGYSESKSHAEKNDDKRK
ncbi:hypothetical protein EYZ11_009408 [Aspergillus tanneri]|uniref:Uncharacterized protein n=1 Tax=Aspergillus tanneri TaxID=1220188 RepID=A0A4S3JA45_9EURO|nr:hypothetical protein EYZ11_009408 [Aspergillus tanneri]